ncbi:superinfection immunity protein [Streptomyces sp. NBC_01335]|uniref:superinfection immunity protein n=1 Tax=Streptomyces sp. NBC_01335 TaxID=2903828 RepID=UPI002E0F0B30|nr:superinfection immunity protein [Streptomyces sp. NBC_01335]
MFSDIGFYELVGMSVLALLFLAVPSFIAYNRRVQRLRLVILVNALGACTGVFWFVALYMALRMRTESDPDPESAPAPGGRLGV